MDTRNSALVVGLYLLCIIIIGVTCFVYFSFERATDQSAIAEDPGIRPSPTSNRNLGPAYTTALAKANRSVRDLESSLSVSKNLVDQRTSALNQKSAECKALRDQLDHALVLLLNLLDEEKSSPAESSDAANVREKLETELSRLQETLETPTTATVDNSDRLVQLQSELIQADLHLTALEEQSQRELQLLTNEKRSVEQTSSEIVARWGVAAVPFLVELLADERVEIRRWAAKALGTIGPDAREASPALRELHADPDATVREEVERALAKMD